MAACRKLPGTAFRPQASGQRMAQHRPNLQFDILPDGGFRHDCRRFALRAAPAPGCCGAVCESPADHVQPWERASRRSAWPSVHVGSYGPAKIPTASDDKLDIERHNVTPEAFGWQVVQTADGPDFIRVIDN